MKYICGCHDKFDPIVAHVLDLAFNYSVEIEANSEEEAYDIFIKNYIEDIELPIYPVQLFVVEKCKRN